MSTNAERIMKAALQIKARIQKEKPTRVLQEQQQSTTTTTTGQEFKFIPMDKPWVTEDMTQTEVFENVLGTANPSMSDFFLRDKDIIRAVIRARARELSKKRNKMYDAEDKSCEFKAVPVEIREKMEKIRTMHLNKESWDTYEKKIDEIDNSIYELEERFNRLQDDEFHEWLKDWIVLQFDHTKYEKLQFLAEASMNHNAKLFNYRSPAPLERWFSAAFVVLDFCYAVGAFDSVE
jgi:hypothetical protein